MLCAGIIHGDLSEYNILVDSRGPVIIDLPQAVDAAANNNAARMLERDVDNLAAYFGQFAPELLNTRYGKEIWKLYESGSLHPDVPLTGRFKSSDKKADVKSVMKVIADAREEAMQRRLEREN
jgi:RIO kinase 1